MNSLAREPWQFTFDELMSCTVPTPMQDGSRSPCKVPDLRADAGTLASVHASDLPDFLGRGYNPRHDVSSLAARVRAGSAIRVYRATDAERTVFPGAYVTPSRAYAVDHGLRNMGRGKFHVISVVASPDDLVPMNPNEFFYAPSDLRAWHRKIVAAAIRRGESVPTAVLEEARETAGMPHDISKLNGLLRAWSSSDASYGIIDKYELGDSWFSGGCMALARAIARWVGPDASIATVIARGKPQHWVASVAGWMLDGDGVSRPAGLRRRWRTRERMPDARVTREFVEPTDDEEDTLCPVGAVSEIAASLRVSLGPVEDYPSLGVSRRQNPARSATLFVALYPDRSHAEALARAGTVDADRVHVTLGFVGRLDALPHDVAERAMKALRRVASTRPPVVAVAGPTRRFRGDDGITYVSLEAPEVERLRAHVVRELLREGVAVSRAHAFKPHVTVGKNPSRSTWAHPSVSGMALRFDALWLVAGTTRTAVPLRGKR